jgi:transposase-like protein
MAGHEQLNAALFDEPLSLEKIIQIAVESRLRMMKGDVGRTAASLQVPRTTLYRWINKWNISIVAPDEPVSARLNARKKAQAAQGAHAEREKSAVQARTEGDRIGA